MENISMVSAERNIALAALRADYSLVNDGLVQEGDMVWDFINAKWRPVVPAEPFLPGQKRPGMRQITDIGREVSHFVAVARKTAAS